MQKLKFNYHTHSHYCDGKGNIEDYIIYAIEHNFTHLGFSAHSPLPFKNNFSIQEEKLDEYSNEIDKLREKYKNKIKIYKSLEMEFIPKLSENFEKLQKRINAKYTLGGIHMVNNPEMPEKLWFIDGPDQKVYDLGLKELFNNDIKKAVTRFYEQTNLMLETQKPDIIVHFDKIVMHNKDRFFSESEPWYTKLVNETIDLIKEQNTICEINARGIYKNRYHDYYPSTKLLKQLKDENIPITLSADAHKPEEINILWNKMLTDIINIGFKEVYYYDEGFKAASIEELSKE